jgi:hypothetical protein
MSEPHFGMRDMYKPSFWFDVSFGENLSFGALIILTPEQFAKVIEEANVSDMKDLKGKPCQVEVTEDNVVSFVKVLKR